METSPCHLLSWGSCSSIILQLWGTIKLQHYPITSSISGYQRGKASSSQTKQQPLTRCWTALLTQKRRKSTNPHPLSKSHNFQRRKKIKIKPFIFFYKNTYLQSWDSYQSYQFTWFQETTQCSRLNIQDNLV